MSKAKGKPLYQRGKYKLDWDRRSDGSYRSPYLAITWYDQATRRVRSASTGTADVEAGKRKLDHHYLTHEHGQTICPTCGQVRSGATSYLVTEAIEAYIAEVGDERASAKAIRSRLAHVLDYIASLDDPAVQCAGVDERWVERFRKWMRSRPNKPSLSTVETCVAQLSAAINHAQKTGQILSPARFKVIPFKEVNRTPEHRSDIEELAAMFCYAQGYPTLHRFLALSVATLARPDAVHDFNVDEQWRGRAIDMNPPDRRRTTKGRPRLPAVRQIVPVLNGASGWFVGVKSVRRQWERMARFIGLPSEGEGGMKLIRRSMAKLLRDRLPASDWVEIELFLGHRKFDEVSSLYAPDRPDYLARAKAGIESVIDEIEQFVPLAFTGLAPEKELARELEEA